MSGVSQSELLGAVHRKRRETGNPWSRFSAMVKNLKGDDAKIPMTI